MIELPAWIGSGPVRGVLAASVVSWRCRSTAHPVSLLAPASKIRGLIRFAYLDRGAASKQSRQDCDSFADIRRAGLGSLAGRGRIGSVMVGFVISFAEADRDRAKWIAYQAGDLGVPIELGLRVGSNRAVELGRLLDAGYRVIAVISPVSVAEPKVMDEWRRALETDPEGVDRRLLPVFVAPCEAPEVGEVAPLRLHSAGDEAAESGDRLPARRRPHRRRAGRDHRRSCASVTGCVRDAARVGIGVFPKFRRALATALSVGCSAGLVAITTVPKLELCATVSA